MTNIVRNALDYLDNGKNWHKGSMYGPNGTACAIGAFMRTDSILNNYSEFSAALNLVDEVAAEQFPDRVQWLEKAANPSAIVKVNDHPDTNWSDIERIFEKAALILDEKVD